MARLPHHHRENPAARGRGWLGLVLPIAIVGAGLISAFDLDPFGRFTRASGVVDSAVLVSAADGSDRLVVLGHADLDRDEDELEVHRVDVVDPATGVRLARVALPMDAHAPRALPAGPGRFWLFEAPGRLTLRSTADGEVQVGHDAIVHAAPELVGGVHGQVLADRWSGGLVLGTAQGHSVLLADDPVRAEPFDRRRQIANWETRLMRVDAVHAAGPEALRRPGALAQFEHGQALARHVTLAPSDVDGLVRVPRLVATTDGSSATTLSAVELHSGDTLQFQAVDGAHVLAVRPAGAQKASARAPGQRYLRPWLLVDQRTGLPIALEPDGGRVVAHRKSLLAHAALCLSRVTPTGERAWTVEHGEGDVRLATTSGGRLVVVVAGPSPGAGYALGIEARTGAVVWRVPQG